MPKIPQMEKWVKTFERRYLRAWHTQQDIADKLGLPKQTLSDKIKSLSENGQMSEIGHNFKPFLYNIWKAENFKPRRTISDKIESFSNNGHLSEITKNFKPKGL